MNIIIIIQDTNAYDNIRVILHSQYLDANRCGARAGWTQHRIIYKTSEMATIRNFRGLSTPKETIIYFSLLDFIIDKNKK